MDLFQSFFESEFWQVHIYANFIAKDRWMYLVNGLKTTVIITLAALVIGIVLGALVAVVRVTYDKADRPGFGLGLLNWLCKLYLTVIRGTPVMVQLLIMYFAVFVTLDPGKLVVAIVAFGINSGAYVAEIFRSGIMSIDPGQMEAGRSLGLGYGQVMLRIIMPQAIKNILPTLVNEIIALLKETSVVGYIALGDLTRGGDQIRSQTYDAFPPLLAVALIYLLMVILLEKAGKMIERRLAQSDRG